MTDFTRTPGVPAPILDAKSAELFDHDLEPLPEKGKLIMVIAGDWCSHCHDMEKNNNYATATTNGTPVRWMNIGYSEVYNHLGAIAGIAFKDGHYNVNGVAITELPTVIEMVDGKAVQITNGVGPLTDKGSLDKIDSNMDAKIKANNQARDAVGDTCKLDTAIACAAPKSPLPTQQDMKNFVGVSPAK